VAGGSYAPTAGGVCTYTIPQTGNVKVMGIFKGVVGSSTAVEAEAAPAGSPYFSFILYPNPFGTPNPGDKYFAAAYSASTLGDAGNPNDALNVYTYLTSYLTTGQGTTSPDLTTLAWQWARSPLTVTANNQTVAVGSPLPALTATVSGFVAPDTASSSDVTGAANCITTVATTSTPGTYPITCTIGTLASANNYMFSTFVPGTLTIVDTIPPVIVINNPQNGHSYLQNDVESIDATVTDNVAVATTTYTLNGVAVSQTQPLPFINLPLGTETLVVSATDTSGNVAYATSTFTLLPPDLTPPTITVTSPTAGATYTNTSSVFLTASITDASPIAATSYTFNGQTIDPTKPLPLLGAPLGAANVSVAAADVYGNAASTTVNFFIKSADVTPPTIIITSPIAGYTYAATSSVLVAATITDASGIATSSYTLNGMPINPSLPLPFAQAGAGPATLVVTAVDNFGNAASSSVSFTIAPPYIQPTTQAPVVTITSPVAGKLYTREDTVFLTATITSQLPIANVRYYFNGQLINQTKALPLMTAPLGSATVSVIAKDSAGNTTTATITFRIVPGVDTCIPDITQGFDNRWIANKQIFSKLFDDCNFISGREHDYNGYYQDDNNHHKNPGDDNRCTQAVADINNAFVDIDHNINH
jgi:hypothetical protein